MEVAVTFPNINYYRQQPLVSTSYFPTKHYVGGLTDVHLGGQETDTPKPLRATTVHPPSNSIRPELFPFLQMSKVRNRALK